MILLKLIVIILIYPSQQIGKQFFMKSTEEVINQCLKRVICIKRRHLGQALKQILRLKKFFPLKKELSISESHYYYYY